MVLNDSNLISNLDLEKIAQSSDNWLRNLSIMIKHEDKKFPKLKSPGIVINNKEHLGKVLLIAKEEISAVNNFINRPGSSSARLAWESERDVQTIIETYFGLRQTLDTIGAFAGPLLAIVLMAATADAFRAVFWLATIPAFVSVLVLVLFVREPQRAAPTARERPRLSRSSVRSARATGGSWASRRCLRSRASAKRS